jgi:hypothetical protein
VPPCSPYGDKGRAPARPGVRVSKTSFRVLQSDFGVYRTVLVIFLRRATPVAPERASTGSAGQGGVFHRGSDAPSPRPNLR